MRVCIPELGRVVQAQALADELLPPVGVLRVGGIGVLFLERGHVRIGLQVLPEMQAEELYR
jgi:hypothetical protein